jgi:hypothetical protein
MRQRLRARLDEVQLDELRKMRRAAMRAGCGIEITPTPSAAAAGAKKPAESEPEAGTYCDDIGLRSVARVSDSQHRGSLAMS